ncbi:choice-of-anchor Q domain-containing protein [Rubrivirga sp. IMCC45206]|uniref:choice-of-anchor Q domain-containing protein n=1 Tax=Rubrivirga sp. IMCC45206 TaxID=3391614 RepID=UPI00398FD090
MRAFSTPLSLALLVTLFSAGASAQTVLYVDADASGTEDGTSWANAFEELDEAIEAARAPAQIWVAEGVYTPTDDPDRKESFRLKNGVEILGGFDGTETSADQRTPDPDEGGTVLSGDIGTVGDDDDNSYHVVTAFNVDNSAVLDGFVVTGGNADGGAPDERGGGLTNYDGGTSNPDTEGYPTLRNVVFEGNSATSGGGVYLNATIGTTVMEDVEFKENEASNGGGIYTNGAIEGEGVEFEENEADERGGGAFVNNTRVTFRDVEFDSNVAGREGVTNSVGRGAGLYSQSGARVTIIDAEFELNRSVGAFPDGAGLLTQGGTLDVVNAVFNGNVARAGAAVMSRNGSATVSLTNVVIAGNQGAEDTWGILDFNDATEVSIAQLSMSGNDGFAMVRISRDVSTEVVNSIFWDNDGPAFVQESGGSGELDVENAIVEGGFPDGESILAADPLFRRAPSDGPDDEWGTADDDYGDLRLLGGSPAINFGDTGDVPFDTFDLDDDGVTAEILPFDIEGEDRVQDGSVDLGAYEGATPGVASEPTAERGALVLSAPAPNPTTGAARLTVTLATAGEVEVVVFDLLGRRVAALHSGALAAGTHPVALDGAALPAGRYLVHARSAAGTATRPLTVAR